jgi:hypothetical protein
MGARFNVQAPRHFEMRRRPAQATLEPVTRKPLAPRLTNWVAAHRLDRDVDRDRRAVRGAAI